MKKTIFISALLILLTAVYGQSQEDSIKYGLLESLKAGVNYHNYSDPDKGNIEVMIWGGIKSPGIYLVPEGTSLVQLISLTGGANEETIYETFKFIRTKDRNPNLKSDSVLVLNFHDFFDKEKKKDLNKYNPTLLSGDIVVFPIKPEMDFWQKAQLVTGVIIVPLLSIANLVVAIINLSR